jgi:hypothetical protein
MTTPERGTEILYLTRQDVIQAGLLKEDILSLVRTALTEHGTRRTEMPAQIAIHPLQDTLMQPCRRGCRRRRPARSRGRNASSVAVPLLVGRLSILRCLSEACWAELDRIARIVVVVLPVPEEELVTADADATVNEGTVFRNAIRGALEGFSISAGLEFGKDGAVGRGTSG